MGTIKTKGIILAEHNMGDYDKMVTLLTPGMGKISCVAKGARRTKSQIMAGSQFLCFADYVLYQGTQTYHINSCETIEVFYHIRTDLDKLKYASHITKLIADVTDENQNCYKIIQLFLNTLYMISETDQNLEWITAVFKLRLMCLLGFVPNVMICGNCKKTAKEEQMAYFSMRESSLMCNLCGRQDKSAIEILPATADAIRYIVMAPAKKLYSFQIPENSIKELSIIAKLYTNEKLEKEYKLEELF